MKAPTRRRERTVAATIAVSVMILVVAAGALGATDLAAWIAVVGLYLVVGYIQVANWLTNQTTFHWPPNRDHGSGRRTGVRRG